MLAYMTIVEITGDDAEIFLQGQITAHLFALPMKSWGFSAYCLPNGRVFTFFYLFRNEKNHILIVLPKDMSEVFCQRLQKFTLRQMVSIKIRSDLGFFVLPYTDSHGFPFSTTGFNALIDNQNKRLQTVDKNIFIASCIKAGIPMIYPITSERFLPQMLNLQALDGLSLTKGCYMGQEGIARVQYKTEIHRHLAFTKAHLLPASIKIGLSIINDQQSPVGVILDFAPSEKSGMIQAVIEDRYLRKSLTLAIENSPTLIFNA